MLITENDPAIHDLRRRLDEFYSATTDYMAFQAPSEHTGHWRAVRQEIERLLAARPGVKVRVLEFGCGVSGFGAYVGDLRDRLALEAQDVTDRNRAHLLAWNDRFHAADLSTLSGPYDIIFSTYAWEHVTNPRATLSHLQRMLAPGGSLFLFCPRYDAPGYFPPSCRHLGLAGRLGQCAGVWTGRVATMLGAPARFVIDADPALFHVKQWYPDADAIHWVSYWDLRRAIGPGYELRRVGSGATGMKSRLIDRMLKLCVQVRKLPDGGGTGRA